MKRALIILFFAGCNFCGTSRSKLLETDLPFHCKLDLECKYFYQKSEGKTECAVIYSQKCAKVLDYIFCKDLIKDIQTEKEKEREYQLCLARLQ